MIFCSFLCFASKFSFEGGFESFSLRNFFFEGGASKNFGEADCQGRGGVWPKCQPPVRGGRGGLAKVSADIFNIRIEKKMRKSTKKCQVSYNKSLGSSKKLKQA